MRPDACLQRLQPGLGQRRRQRTIAQIEITDQGECRRDSKKNITSGVLHFGLQDQRPETQHQQGNGKLRKYDQHDCSTIFELVKPRVRCSEQQYRQDRDRLHHGGDGKPLLQEAAPAGRFQHRRNDGQRRNDDQHPQHHSEIAEIRQQGRCGVLIYTCHL